MNGVTGRMGTNQHLSARSSPSASRAACGWPMATWLMPDPILVGRNADKLKAPGAQAHGLSRCTTDLGRGAGRSAQPRSTSTPRRPTGAPTAVRKADRGRQGDLLREADRRRHRRRRWRSTGNARRPGSRTASCRTSSGCRACSSCAALIESGFFGKILSVRGEFGYWVFEGDRQPAQRPSWNYRKEDGGGIIVDMLCHWRYVIDNLFGNVKTVSCLGATHIPSAGTSRASPTTARRTTPPTPPS